MCDHHDQDTRWIKITFFSGALVAFQCCFLLSFPKLMSSNVNEGERVRSIIGTWATLVINILISGIFQVISRVLKVAWTNEFIARLFAPNNNINNTFIYIDYDGDPRNKLCSVRYDKHQTPPLLPSKQKYKIQKKNLHQNIKFKTNYTSWKTNKHKTKSHTLQKWCATMQPCIINVRPSTFTLYLYIDYWINVVARSREI